MEEIELETPIREEDVRRLRAGNIVYVSGTLVTARDAAHKRMLQYLKEEKKLPLKFDGLPLFHCGPLVKKINNEWKVLAAGPTTSMRMEIFEAELIKKLRIRLIIGKGGMGERTKKAIMEFGVAYGAFTGGAAVYAARRIKKVKDAKWLDLGVTEALWVFEVDRFGPLIIGIDSHGNSLYEKYNLDT